MSKGTFLRTTKEPGWTQIELLDQIDRVIGRGSRVIRQIDDLSALRQSVITGGVDIIAQDIGKVPLRLAVETSDATDYLLADQHPWARKLALDPSRHQTWLRVWLQAIHTLVLRQECVFYKRRRNRLDPAPDLIPLDHREWTQNTSSDGRFFYMVSAATSGRAAMLGFNAANLSEDDVIHVVMRSDRGYEGLSTLAVGADVLGLNAMIIEFQASLVKGGKRPTGFITVPELMNDEAFERLRQQIVEEVRAAAEEGKPLVLEQGAEFKRIGLDAAQVDLIAARNHMAREVARLLRIPPYKLGMTEDLNRSNMAIMEQAYVDDTLVPVCEAIEQEYTRALLSEDDRLRGLKFRFDREMLYNRDPQANRERVEAQFKAGILFLSEARRRLGFSPVDEGQDHRSLPVNTAMVFRDGGVQIFTSKTDPRSDANDVAAVDPEAQGQRRASDDTQG